jgi:hypothetical protein
MSKQQLIKQSLKLISDNPSHTFFAVTVRPYEAFIKSFRWHERVTVTEKLLETIIGQYDSHLIKYPNRPKNQYLKAICHNAIETKTKSGSPDIPHSHGIWGIHDSLLVKYDSDILYDRIKARGSFKYDDQIYPLRDVLHSIKRESFTSNLLDKTSPENWLDYAYKWAFDTDPSSIWSRVDIPARKIIRGLTYAPSPIKQLPANKNRTSISRFSELV